MKKFKPTLAVLVAATAAMGMYAEHGSKQPGVFEQFAGLGDLPDGLPYSVANGISADGNTVVGYSHSAKGIEAFRWTPAEGMNGLGFQNALATSSDGSVVVGQTLKLGRSRPICWTTADGVVDLEMETECRRAGANGVTADGAIVVGVFGVGLNETEGSDRGCVWLLRGKSVPRIMDSEEQMQSDAYGVSGDGRVVVGASRLSRGHAEAFRWTAETGMAGLGCLPGHTTSSAYAASADGSVIVGYSSNYTTTTAFRWSEETGMMPLGEQDDLGGDSWAYAVSADGAVVAGTYSNRQGQDAVIWDAARTMRPVRDLLPTNIVRGWRLQMATAVSADGNVLAGAGKNPLGNREAWVARIDSGPWDEPRPIALHDAIESPNVQQR